jgi:hypothetical protein
MRKNFSSIKTGLNLQENHCELSHIGLGSALAENSFFSYDQLALESERLCNLLDCKKEELAMCKPGSWMHREIQVEITEIRTRLNHHVIL